MKKILCTMALVIATMLSLVSCMNMQNEEYSVSITNDGHIVVNGTVTDYTLKMAADTIQGSSRCIECGANILGKVIYSTEIGTKIEDLVKEKQDEITTYVNKCKEIYLNGYVNAVGFYLDDYKNADIPSDRLGNKPYLEFTDTFVYDFKNVNEDEFDKSSETLWNAIKSLYDSDARPVMYIELSGYNQFFQYYKQSSFESASIFYGYFVLDDGNIVPYNYNNICRTVYYYQVIEGTEQINCGNKYAEVISLEKIFAAHNK